VIRNVLRRFSGRLALIAFLACLLLGSVCAQEPAQTKTDRSDTAAAPASESPNAGVGKILAKTTEQAASQSEKWGRKLGIGPNASFAISVGFNFLSIAVLFYFVLRSKLPQAFRERTAAIQKGIREAQAASADASRRLSEIEARLAKLDTEVAEIRASAEREATTEEERIRQAAEEDKRKVVEGAESEITAIARNARRELKSYAATLAVDLAARKIHVDESTDRGLVREFVDQLGKGGK
jgi:F-type H+-transporting ATPase subunit b